MAIPVFNRRENSRIVRFMLYIVVEYRLLEGEAWHEKYTI
jgi:hypothetical protein